MSREPLPRGRTDLCYAEVSLRSHPACLLLAVPGVESPDREAGREFPQVVSSLTLPVLPAGAGLVASPANRRERPVPTRSSVRNAELIDRWVLNRGYICPGYQRPAHKAHPRWNPLTIDHIKPRRRGGPDVLSNLRVLCRKCNSSKKDRPDTTITVGPSFPHPFKNRD